MQELEAAVVVEFPLRGEWTAPTTPAKRIPSHGTNLLGERYAYDFVRVDWERGGRPFYRGNLLQYLTSGVPLAACYGWDQDVHAPCEGTVIQAEDGVAERARVHPLSDALAALNNTAAFRDAASRNAAVFDPGKDGIRSVAGNYVVMQCGRDVYAALAHLRDGSVRVSAGQTLRKGDVIGKVGHSGNSTAPHLHFQLMDSRDLLIARGIPCAFERYEVYRNGVWKTVSNAIPADTDRIRYHP